MLPNQLKGTRNNDQPVAVSIPNAKIVAPVSHAKAPWKTTDYRSMEGSIQGKPRTSNHTENKEAIKDY